MPGANDQHHSSDADREYQIRHDPCDEIESAGRRRSEHSWSVLLYKTLQNTVIAVSPIDCRCQFCILRREIWTPVVIAFQQNLLASAHADQFMSDLFHACRVVACTRKNGECQAEHP